MYYNKRFQTLDQSTFNGSRKWTIVPVDRLDHVDNTKQQDLQQQNLHNTRNNAQSDYRCPSMVRGSSNWSPMNQHLHGPIPISWDTETIYGFSDAAWKESSRLAGFGWIFKRADTSTINSGSKLVSFVNSPLMAKALVMREALLQAIGYEHQNLHMTSNSQQLIH